jgi:hypothetical protein
MKIMELALFPASPRVDVMGRDACVFIWHMIIEKNSVLNGHRSQARISNIRPMNGGVKHHGPSDGHDALDTTLSASVVVMSTRASEMNDLFEF